MIIEVMMPKFGLSMEAGVIGSWLVQEGDVVSPGDEILEVETDKISNTVEASEGGIVRKLLFEEGEEIACGVLIAIIADISEDIEHLICKEYTSTKEEQVVENIPNQAVFSIKDKKDIKITPRALRIAEEKGIDYTCIEGTGIHGAITIDDLKRHVKDNQNNPKHVVAKPVQEVEIKAEPTIKVGEVKPVESVGCKATVNTVTQCYDTNVSEDDVVVKMTKIQSVIAKSMYESLQSTAQTTIATELEVSPLSRVYNDLKGKYKNVGIKLSYTAMIIKAVAIALENHPKLRTTIVDESHLKTTNKINIGVAIDIPNGLIVPVIKDANLKDLRSICLELADLSERAKNNKLTTDELTGGTLTITNLGMFGITYFTPVLNNPESAILGIGSMVEKVCVKDGAFYPGKVMNMSLTMDHRVVDGAPGARFLQEVTQNLLDFRWI